MAKQNLQSTVLGGGCFWCLEAIFQKITGVRKVVSGYTGGTAPGSPTYREVCSGLTGHAEVVKLTFDANIISYHTILEVFMTSHDPTTLNRQGGDAGTQYRSAIYYFNKQQKEISEQVLKEMTPIFSTAITTEISPLKTFYAAETSHQNYYNNNSSQEYCNVVISPKLAKLRKTHADKLKTLRCN